MLTAITISGLPEGAPPFQFRCYLASHTPDGQLLLEQETQPRTQPDWLIKYRHEGRGQLSVRIEFRASAQADWFSAGEFQLNPAEVLDGERGAVAEVGLSTCQFAPNMSVRL